MLLTFASFMHIKLFQIDVKSDFPNDNLQGKVYIEQSSGFENWSYLNHVYKLDNIVYDFK